MDYLAYIPTDGDHQESIKPWTETNGCEPFSDVHGMEILYKFVFGVEKNWSEQALYQQCLPYAIRNSAGIIIGFRTEDVWKVFTQVGLVLTSLSPEPVNFTIEQFLTPIDPTILATGVQFFDECDVSREIIGPNPTPEQIAGIFDKPNTLPWVTIKLADNVYHQVVLVNPTTKFDSYGKLVKPLVEPIVYAETITLNKKGQTMQLIDDKGTLFLVGSKGKLGFADPNAASLFQLIEDTTQGDTSSILEVGVCESGVVLHKK